LSLIESFWSSKSFSFRRLVQPLVGAVLNVFLDGQGADVVSDFAAEVVLARLGMSIFSSMARIRRSSGSSYWPVYLLRTFSRCVYALMLSM